MTNPPKRRWYQFSLRTLMILVTLLTAAAGLYIGLSRDPNRPIIGKWISHINGRPYSAIFRKDGTATIGLEGPGFDSSGGPFTFDPAKGTVTFKVWYDGGTKPDELRPVNGHLTEDGTLVLGPPDLVFKRSE